MLVKNAFVQTAIHRQRQDFIFDFNADGLQRIAHRHRHVAAAGEEAANAVAQLFNNPHGNARQPFRNALRNLILRCALLCGHFAQIDNIAFPAGGGDAQHFIRVRVYADLLNYPLDFRFPLGVVYQVQYRYIHKMMRILKANVFHLTPRVIADAADSQEYLLSPGFFHLHHFRRHSAGERTGVHRHNRQTCRLGGFGYIRHRFIGRSVNNYDAHTFVIVLQNGFFHRLRTLQHRTELDETNRLIQLLSD